MSPVFEKIPNKFDQPIDAPYQNIFLDNIILLPQIEGRLNEIDDRTTPDRTISPSSTSEDSFELQNDTNSDSFNNEEVNLESYTVQIFPEIGSLQRMTLYSPNLQELNLDNSQLFSLRDLSSELLHLKIIHINNCSLTSLDGIFNLRGLRELYASQNFLYNLMPCSSLKHLTTIDLSFNLFRSIRPFTFIKTCKKLISVRIEGNTCCNNPNWENALKHILPQLRVLNGTLFNDPSEVETVEDDSSTSTEPSITIENIDL